MKKKPTLSQLTERPSLWIWRDVLRVVYPNGANQEYFNNGVNDWCESYWDEESLLDDDEVEFISWI